MLVVTLVFGEQHRHRCYRDHGAGDPDRHHPHANLDRAKPRLGNQLGSAATTGEGTQNRLYAGLSLAILLGLAANLFLGLTWADPLVALVLAVAAVHTGLNTWKGRGCTPRY